MKEIRSNKNKGHVRPKWLKRGEMKELSKDDDLKQVIKVKEFKTYGKRLESKSKWKGQKGHFSIIKISQIFSSLSRRNFKMLKKGNMTNLRGFLEKLWIFKEK